MGLTCPFLQLRLFGFSIGCSLCYRVCLWLLCLSLSFRFQLFGSDDCFECVFDRDLIQGIWILVVDR